MKTETIVKLNLDYCTELKERAYQLTSSYKIAEEITAIAFVKLVKNSFWIFSEKQAKQYLKNCILKESRKLKNSTRK